MAIERGLESKLDEWFSSKGGLTACVVCGSSQGWNVGQVIQPAARPPTLNSDGVVVDEREAPPLRAGFPLLELICRNCAYVMLFAAKPMGLV